ncbi:MAG: TMEM165/GDT1 family protein [Salinirussus sp.]
MASFVEVVVVAFGYQLAVLPGEKVQFIIAGLSARYRPIVVVTAAGSAFAAWTALEIIFGGLLTQILPGDILDALTAGLFLLFAVLLVRSAPEDGRSSSWERDTPISGISIPGIDRGWNRGSFASIFTLMAAGEVGDKTQLVTIGLAAQYGAHPGIWMGEMLAIIPVSLANAYLFHRLTHRINLRSAHYVGAGIFLFFGADTVLALATGISVWEWLITAAASLFLTVVP